MWPFMIIANAFAVCMSAVVSEEESKERGHREENREEKKGNANESSYAWDIFIFCFCAEAKRQICAFDHRHRSHKNHCIGILWTPQQHSIISHCGWTSLTNTLWTLNWLFFSNYLLTICHCANHFHKNGWCPNQNKCPHARTIHFHCKCIVCAIFVMNKREKYVIMICGSVLITVQSNGQTDSLTFIDNCDWEKKRNVLHQVISFFIEPIHFFSH